jgi:hypothetical protein
MQIFLRSIWYGVLKSSEFWFYLLPIVDLHVGKFNKIIRLFSRAQIEIHFSLFRVWYGKHLPFPLGLYYPNKYEKGIRNCSRWLIVSFSSLSLSLITYWSTVSTGVTLCFICNYLSLLAFCPSLSIICLFLLSFYESPTSSFLFTCN